MGVLGKRVNQPEKRHGLLLNEELEKQLVDSASVNGLGPLPMPLNAPTDRPPFPSLLDFTQSDVHADVMFDGTILSVNELSGKTAIMMSRIGLLIDEVSPVAHNFAFGIGLVHVSKPRIQQSPAFELRTDDDFHMEMDPDFPAGTYVVWLNCG